MMEWVAILVWALLVAVGLPLAVLGGVSVPALGVQVFAAGAGLTLCVLFVVLGGGVELLWLAVGVAVAGLVTMAFASASLVSDYRSISARAQAAEEHAAVLAGVPTPLFGVAVFVTLLGAGGMVVSC